MRATIRINPRRRRTAQAGGAARTVAAGEALAVGRGQAGARGHRGAGADLRGPQTALQESRRKGAAAALGDGRGRGAGHGAAASHERWTESAAAAGELL